MTIDTLLFSEASCGQALPGCQGARMSQSLPCPSGVPRMGGSTLKEPCLGLQGFIEGVWSLFLENEWVRKPHVVYGEAVRMELGF